MNRDSEILIIASRKVRQGFSVDQQYVALNRARDKRAKRNAKRKEQMLNGGWAQIPILRGSK